MSTSVLTVNRFYRSVHAWRSARVLAGISLVALASGAYLALTSHALTDSLTIGPSQTRTVVVANDHTTMAAQVDSRTAFDARADTGPVWAETSDVLTIAVDGPIGGSAPPYRVHVSPEEMMDTFHRLCIRLPES